MLTPNDSRQPQPGVNPPSGDEPPKAKGGVWILVLGVLGLLFGLFALVGLVWGIRLDRRVQRGELGYSVAVVLGSVLCAVVFGIRTLVAVIGWLT